MIVARHTLLAVDPPVIRRRGFFERLVLRLRRRLARRRRLPATHELDAPLSAPRS